MRRDREIFGLMFEDFDHRPEPAPQAPPPLAGPGEDEIAAAFRAACHAAASAAFVARSEATQALLMGMARDIAATREQAEAAMQTVAESGSRLIISALRVLLPRVARRFALEEARGVLHLVSDVLRAEPGAIVAMAPQTAEALRTELAALHQELPAGLDLRPTPGMGEGDVAVTWEGGAVRRDTTALLDRLDAMLSEESR